LIKNNTDLNLLYITAQTPFGKKEAFILEEILSVKEQGINVHVIPRNPPRFFFHKRAEELSSKSVWLPMISLPIIIQFAYSLLVNIILRRTVIKVLRNSRNLNTAIKNLVVIPKSVYILKFISKWSINHVHVHWGTTTATMAYIISEITDIPWTMTLHRHDIGAKNLLKLKCESAQVVRCTSHDALKELQEEIGRDYDSKIKIIYTGVQIPQNITDKINIRKTYHIACPAFLEIKKGHVYLLKALSQLLSEGYKNFHCFFYGDGPMKNKLVSYIKNLKLTKYVTIAGTVPHENLLHQYSLGNVSIVVLPSIIERNGEREGIPISLIEAMAYSIPVISTKTGGIPELLNEEAGILVNEKSSKHLFEAISMLWKDYDKLKSTGLMGYKRVKQHFNIISTTLELIEFVFKLQKIN
jgi:glycosyltransferase involved in cell wall biosynthesis